MKIRFWGVRGSIAAPGSKTSDYGGNTSCVEVVEGDRSIILDAGTGIRDLGNEILKNHRGRRQEIALFLSHFHIDHLCGLPFFRPLYRPGTDLHIYGPEGFRKDLRTILADFFSEEFFPVPLSKLPAKLNFHLLNGRTVNRPPFRVASFYINHPGWTLGYVVACRGKRIAYLCDHEPLAHYRHLRRETEGGYRRRLARHLKGLDLLIHDAQFTDNQYPYYKGWGHSPWSYPVRLAEEARVKRLVLFHHAPENNDGYLNRSFRTLRRRLKERKSKLTVLMAREGKTISL
jgi:phosphoribosyl 1,2-cyclic phosphodiesterase